ncbi:MAG: hypothetical protein AAFQ94_28760 [Bacteroidota bacterium]
MKRKDLRLERAIEITKKLNSEICIGKNKRFRYDFQLENPGELEEIRKKYSIISQNLLLSFQLNDSNQLNRIFNSPKLYTNAYFFNQKNTNPDKSYTSYWIDINGENQTFWLSISLPYTAGIEASKIELENVLNYLVKKELIFIVHYEIKDLSKMIIDLNSSKFNGGWSYKDRFTISAWGNFTPKGSNQKRPADVKLTFESKDFERYGGYEKMAIEFHKALTEYFDNTEFYVQGSIISKFDTGILEQLTNIEFTSIKIPLNVDMEAKPNFSISDIDLTSNEEKNISIEEFDWLGSNPNHGFNRVNLWIKNIDDFELDIEISKEIKDDYYLKIESLIDEKLEYLGME